jgi:hypothetical protein
MKWFFLYIFTNLVNASLLDSSNKVELSYASLLIENWAQRLGSMSVNVQKGELVTRNVTLEGTV